MDQNQVDLFLASFVGGVIGGGLLMTTMYYYFKSVYIRYRETREELWDVIALRKLEADVEKLKKGMAAVSKEIYERYESETK